MRPTTSIPPFVRFPDSLFQFSTAFEKTAEQPYFLRTPTRRWSTKVLAKRLLIVGILVVTWRSAARAQDTATADARLVLSRLYSAIVRGDSSVASSLIADDLVWVNGAEGSILTKPVLVAAASHPSPARFEIDSLRARRYGTTLVADYVRHDHWPMGSGEFITSWRALAVIVQRDGGSRIVRHTLSWLARPVQPIDLDSSALQPFVGRYQIAPGYIDNVHWEARNLVATVSGQSVGARLVPVSVSAFSPDGIGAVITFERDGAGKVIDYVQAYPDGRIIRALRLP